MFAVTLNPKIQVIAFEPNPMVRERLRNNLILNRFLTQVNIIPYGLSVNTRIAEFFIPPKSGSSAASLENLHPFEGEPSRIQIQLVSLDEIIHTQFKVDVIKMDIEGSEYQAILGGEKLIASQQPVIIIELLRKWMKPFGSHPQDVFLKLEHLGYSCFGINDKYLRNIKEIDEKTEETNYLFLPKRKNISILKDFWVI